MPKNIVILLLLFVFHNAGAAESTSDAQAPDSDYAKPIDEKAHDKDTCAAKWDRYHKSQECFAPYQNINGSFKPGAFEHCTEVKYPTDCPL